LDDAAWQTRSSWPAPLTQQLRLPDGEKNPLCGQGTRVKLVACAGADEAGCPAEPLGVAAAEPAGVVAPAAGDAGADVAGADADPEADEFELCGLHPTMSTPATARAAPVSNVR